MTEAGLTRFKKARYAGGNSSGDVPRWHIAAKSYRKGEFYNSFEALCGYAIEDPWRKDTMLRISVNIRGPQCTKCKIRHHNRKAAP